MKNFKTLKILIYFIFISAILSCNNDDNEIDQTNELIGVWQRDDVSENFENKFIFNSDNSGYKTTFEGNLPDTAISNAVTFNWSTSDNKLTLDFSNEIITTCYSINTNRQLFLSDLSDLPFNRLEQ